ncbi:MAG: hypothetical protein ACKO83_09645, partial [Roseiflexaceae bacterium]
HPGNADPALLNVGQAQAPQWVPAECDVSIRPGWFYHQHEDDKVRTPANLWELYLASVGRGANLLLNLPVSPAGQVHPHDRAALLEFQSMRTRAFAHNLAAQAQFSASSQATPVAGCHDGGADTFWMAEATDAAPWLQVQWAQAVTIHLVDMREYLPLGQRIHAWHVDVATATGWTTVAQGQSIGNRRLVSVPAVRTQALRICVDGAGAPAALGTVGVY